MLNIKPITRDSFDCMTGILATVAEYYHKDYQLALISHWSLFFEKQKLLGKSVKRMEEYTRENCALFPLLKKYHGLDLGKEIHGSLKDSLSDLKNEIDSQNPVILRLIEEDFPWAELSYASHFCLLIGIEDDALFFLDPYDSEKVQRMEIKSLENHKIGYFTICNCDYYHRTLKEVLSDLVKSVQGIFLPMNRFIKELALLDSINEETVGYGDYEIPLFQEIKFLHEGRLNVMILLGYLEKHYNWHNGREYIEEMQKIATLWFKTRIFFMKIRHKKDQRASLGKICEKLAEIRDREMELFMQIKTECETMESLVLFHE